MQPTHTPNECLDEALKFLSLKDDDTEAEISDADVMNHLMNGYDENITPIQARRIINKLRDDGYIMISLGSVYLTFEGSFFVGYQQQQIIDDRNERRIVRNERLLVNGTWFAGFAAVFLLAWQMFVYFYPVHKDFPYWIWETIPKK
jgi:hypothetical protein